MRAEVALGWRALALTGALSVAAHAGVLVAVMPRAEAVQMAGGGGGALAALGSDFEDFVQGGLPSRPEMAEAAPPTRAAPTPPDAPVPPAATTAVPATPPQTALTTPALAAPIPLAAVAPSPSPRAIALTPAAAVAPLTAAAPVAQSLSPSAITPMVPSQTARPPAPETLVPAPEIEVREAQADTPRPRQRPDPQAAAAQPAGNSDRNARRGVAEGVTQGTAAQAPAAQAGATPGNAQASNYPGEVLRRIQSVRQARVSARGTAVVAFTVGADGGLDSVRIARASGSVALDQAALDHIRRAGPFPRPPAGAQRQFSFEFVGR